MKKVITISLLLIMVSGGLAVFGQEKETEIREREREKAEERARQFFRQSTGSAVVTPAVPDASMIYSHGDGFQYITGGGSSSSQLSLSKRFDGESADNDGSFDVDKSVRVITIQMSGSASEGEIEIEISLPNGDTMKDLSIDASADIQFSQTIRIAEEEDKYYGEWEYTVSADEAVGHYRLSIQTR